MMESAYDFVTEAFRCMGNKDEWPVWGPLQRAVEDQPEADHLIASPESLKELLSRFFSKRILIIVVSHLVTMKCSWLGEGYSLRGTYGSYAKGMICTIVEHLDNMAATASGGHDRGHRGQGGGPKRGSGRKEGQGRGQRRGRGRESDSAGAGWSGDGGNRCRRREPVNAALDLYDFGHGIRGHQRFSSVEVKDVVTTLWTTPKKDSAGSEACISRRSQEFVEAVKRIWEIPNNYDLGLWAGDQPYVYLYHGTRTSNILKFQSQGILPLPSVVQDFSKEPAFYTTNLLRTAYEHVLHQRPGLNRNVSTRDTVSILVFRISSAILHGDSACKDNYFFRTEWFSGQEDQKWKQFCKMNWNSCVPTTPLQEFDVVSGAISVPKRLTSKNLVTEVSSVTDPNTGERPQQIALTSKMSQSWLASQLILILREVWSPPEAYQKTFEELQEN